MHLREVFGVSERRACRVTGQQRTTQRHVRRVLAPEEALRARLRAIARTWPRYGFRRAWALLRLEGWVVNRKRVQRLWREEGLRVPASAVKRRRIGTSTVPARRLSAQRPNHVWALDFIFDATADGRPIKALSMCDEFTRENVARRLGRSITADDVTHALDEGCARRGVPEYLRCDNGPSSLPAPSATGAGRMAPARRTSNPEVRGRTRTSKASTAGSATSSSRVKFSRPSPRRGCCSTTGATPTIVTGPTARLATCRPRSSRRRSINRNSHRRWTTKRGPVRISRTSYIVNTTPSRAAE